MACVARLAGAIVAATWVDGIEAYFLVGDTKVPCDWSLAGFERPADRNVSVDRYVRLVAIAEVALGPSFVEVGIEGELLAQLLADRLLVDRNGSVSERLWRIVTNVDDDDDAIKSGVVDARWLAEIPARAWDIVRDTVLRCT